ncbi:MAG: sensor histidine kinase [Defluviimonas sp.]|nr:sensor histidine kinase [Defluviimonas sp.]
MAEIEYVKSLAARKIRGFRGTIDERGEYLDEVYQSNARLTANIASDYRDRFLIELIQNAYDAHPVGTRDGQIKVILDMREGEFGTLFVANKGRPFAEGNVKDLCDIGLSRKPLGESIGNKGLGFRSVVQITDAPSVYSQSVATASESHFSGFCFRFARPDDYAELIDDRRHLQLASRDLPIFHIPIWIDEQTRSIRDFAEEGFSTVIQLPLRDAVATESVRRQIIDLHDQKVPMLLFLERASSLAVRIVAEAGQVETELSFTRSEDVYNVAGLQLARVDLGGAGTFFMARRLVAESKIKDAIEKGIARKELNEHWERWAGDGEVAVAVRLDAVVQTPRLYTFLPMGEQANAPFAGHLHGSFFPSSNRKHLNARIKLNALLLTEATSLAAEAIDHLVNFPSGKTAEWLTSKERATAVVDLLCWAQVGSLETDEDLPAKVADRLTVLFGVDDFQDAPLVPCLAPRTEEHLLTWQPPTSARRWPEGHEVFSAEVAAALLHKSHEGFIL